MSDEQQDLQLSVEMVRDLQARLQENDARAADPGVASQYLAAVIGFLLGQINAATEQKKEFLSQLEEFAAGVIDDVEAQQELQAAQPGGGQPGDGQPGGGQPATEQAKSGIWTPGDD